MVAEKGGAQAPWAPLLDPPLEKIIPFTVPYLQEIWTATAEEIYVALTRFWIIMQYESVGLKTATL